MDIPNIRIDGQITPDESAIYSRSSAYILSQLDEPEQRVFNDFMNGKKIPIGYAKDLGKDLDYIIRTADPPKNHAENIRALINELETLISSRKVTDFMELGGYGAASNLSYEIEGKLKGLLIESIKASISTGKSADLKKSEANISEPSDRIAFTELTDEIGILNLNVGQDTGLLIYKLMPYLITGLFKDIIVYTNDPNTHAKRYLIFSLQKEGNGNYSLNVYGQPKLHIEELKV